MHAEDSNAGPSAKVNAPSCIDIHIAVPASADPEMPQLRSHRGWQSRHMQAVPPLPVCHVKDRPEPPAKCCALQRPRSSLQSPKQFAWSLLC
mmetsp:Transcript_28372/g.90289  ORF Transcript_28372/g.90289 Transcript_28372/m.90289 type:complete len:92 (-) Transcript_28372:1238-1513(-)